MADCNAIAQMCAALWPDTSAKEHGHEVLRKIKGRGVSTLPVAIFVAEVAADKSTSRNQLALQTSSNRRVRTQLIGFIEVGLRSHADGCNESHAVGFLEGWYVIDDWRNRGVGRSLVAAAEQWCRSHGCKEMASDTWIDNEPSQRAHEALGYEMVDRCVHYRKTLE